VDSTQIDPSGLAVTKTAAPGSCVHPSGAIALFGPRAFIAEADCGAVRAIGGAGIDAGETDFGVCIASFGGKRVLLLLRPPQLASKSMDTSSSVPRTR
jgi:hypothetical protein